MPRSAREKAIHGTLPEYANKRLKVAEVCLRTKDRKPVEILKTHGFFMEFDETGNARQALAKFAIRGHWIFVTKDSLRLRKKSQLRPLSSN